MKYKCFYNKTSSTKIAKVAKVTLPNKNMSLNIKINVATYDLRSMVYDILPAYIYNIIYICYLYFYLVILLWYLLFILVIYL